MYTWVFSINSTSIELWGMFGQWAGAIATFIAVLVALRQVRISQDQTKFSQQQVELSQKQTETALQQTELAIKQMEEARRREEKALKPNFEIFTKILSFENNQLLTLRIIITNTKPVPVYVSDYVIMQRVYENDRIIDNELGVINLDGSKYYSSIQSEKIKSEIPEIVPFGDICITDIPVELFKSSIGKRKHYGLFEFIFTLSTGQKYTISIYLEYRAVSFADNNNVHLWHLYTLYNTIDTIDEIKKDDNLIGTFTHMSDSHDLEDFKLIY